MNICKHQKLIYETAWCECQTETNFMGEFNITCEFSNDVTNCSKFEELSKQFRDTKEIPNFNIGL